MKLLPKKAAEEQAARDAHAARIRAEEEAAANLKATIEARKSEAAAKKAAEEQAARDAHAARIRAEEEAAANLKATIAARKNTSTKEELKKGLHVKPMLLESRLKKKLLPT